MYLNLQHLFSVKHIVAEGILLLLYRIFKITPLEKRKFQI